MQEKNLIHIGNEVYLRVVSKPVLVTMYGFESISLTPTEYKVLTFFLEHKNSSVSLNNLAVHLWGSNFAADGKEPDSIKGHIVHLRHKLGKLDSELKFVIETNHGFGTYAFREVNKNVSHDVRNVSNVRNLPDDGLKALRSIHQEMDEIVYKMEALQLKIVQANLNNDRIWEDIYRSRLVEAKRLFDLLQRKASALSEALEASCLEYSSQSQGFSRRRRNALYVKPNPLKLMHSHIREAVGLIGAIHNTLDDTAVFLLRYSLFNELIEYEAVSSICVDLKDEVRKMVYEKHQESE